MRLADRLDRCFDPAEREEAQDYLVALREAWRDITAALTRNAWIIILLLAAYELASRGAVSSVTVGPFALANLKNLRIFVPTIVSYLFYEQILLVTRWIETETAHRYLMNMLTPRIEEGDFDAFLAPRLPALSNLVHSYSHASATPSKHLRAGVQYLLGALLLLSIPLFDALALKDLYSELSSERILYWSNVVVSGALITSALIVSILWIAEERLVV